MKGARLSMKVVIIGAGKIGFNLARILVQQNHDVIVLEKEEERAKSLQETLDIQVVIGNGASVSALEEAGIGEASLVIAVTETDEVNMIACMMAKRYGVAKTVARVRNPEYVDETCHSNGAFSGIDLIINPELVTAKEIAKLIDVPEALDVLYYGKGKIQLLELKIAKDAPVTNQYIKDLKFNYPFLIIAIFRKGKLIIPRGSDQLLHDDIIFILGKTKEMIRIERFLGTERKRANKVTILGGGFTAFHLAKILEARKYSVKIIEKEYKRCVDTAANLNTTMVLHGDATDIDLLKAEGTSNTDVFVCLTDDDKLNLLVSLIAKHLGAKRAIAQVRRSDYIDLMESVGIDVGVSPRTLTANAILKFINRGRNVVSVTLLSNESAEMIEVIITPDAKVANKKIRDLSFPQGAIVGSICRNDEQVIIASGEEQLKPGDMVTVFALPGAISKVLEYFAAH